MRFACAGCVVGCGVWGGQAVLKVRAAGFALREAGLVAALPELAEAGALLETAGEELGRGSQVEAF